MVGGVARLGCWKLVNLECKSDVISGALRSVSQHIICTMVTGPLSSFAD